MSLNSLPIGLVLFVGLLALFYWGMKRNRTPILLIFPCFPALVIAINYLLTKKKLEQLKASEASARSAAQGPAAGDHFGTVPGGAPSAGPAFQASLRDEALLRSPAPRQIRMAKRGRIAMSVAALGLSLFVIPTALSV